MNIMQIKNNKTLIQMSCTAYIVYTFHLTLHHENFGQFKAKQVLCSRFLPLVWQVMDDGEEVEVRSKTHTENWNGNPNKYVPDSRIEVRQLDQIRNSQRKC